MGGDAMTRELRFYSILILVAAWLCYALWVAA
jgi:hypothetical protein